MTGWLGQRSTSDLLVLMIAGTICFTLLASGATIALETLLHPEQDHAGAVAVISDTLQMLVSLLAGFIAGRTETRRAEQETKDPS